MKLTLHLLILFFPFFLSCSPISITSNSDKGKFNPATGQECSECPAGFFQQQNTNPSLSCLACPTGFVQPLEGSSSCSDLGGIKPSDCKDDQYFNATLGNCEDCPPGGSCVGPITTSGIRALFGWSQCPNKSLTYERCVFGAACLGAPNPALKGKFKLKESNGDVSELGFDPALADNISACAPPYLEGGLICASCAPGYSHSGLGDKCDECPSDGDNTAVAVSGTILGLVGLIGYIQLTLSNAGKLEPADGAQSIGMSYVQVVSLLLTFPIKW